MTVNLTPPRTRVLITNSTNSLDVSEAFLGLSLSAGAWDESGWWRLRGTLRLAAYVAGFSERFDCRDNQARWAPGNLVEVALWFGSWVPLPVRLRILRYPSRPWPGDPTINLEVGGDGDLLNYRAPEGDPSGITYGTPTAATSLINAALARAGTATTADTITGYTLPFAPEKQDGKSWIAYAGEVAYVGRHVLWQQADGAVRATPLAVDGLEPFAHYVVGQDEADYSPSEPQESPPETVRANGDSYLINSVGDTENVTVETVDGVTVRTTIIYKDRDTTTPEYSERVEQPANIVLPLATSSTALVTDTLLERDWTYNNLTSRLDQEVETLRRPVGAVFPGRIFGNPFQLVVDTRTITDYDYTINDLVRERVTRLEIATIVGVTVTTALAQVTTERWRQVGEEEFIYTRTQVNYDGSENPLPQRRSGSTNTQPPSTQYRPAAKQRQDVSYQGTAKFQAIAGSDFGEKLWVIQLPSGMVTGNGQCRAIAQLWGRIRQGRQFGVSWAADITAAWLQSFTPVRRVDFSVPTPGVGWVRSAYLLDALTIDIDQRSAAIGGMGIEIGQVEVIPFTDPPPVVQQPGAEPEEGLPEPEPGAGIVNFVLPGGYLYGGQFTEVQIGTEQNTASGGYRYGGRFADESIGPILLTVTGGYRYGGRWRSPSEAEGDYLRPDGESTYLRPDAESTYLRPEP